MMAKNLTKAIYVALSFGAAFTISNSAMAAPASPPAPKGDLSAWEERLLGQQYERDPIDKRVQRLELLIFGGAQEGTLTERLTELRSAINSKTAMRQTKSSVGQALNQLEQRILKKTFAAEQVENRLARLETKLFGKPSPAMAAPDRIDRLKKTIGMGEPPPIAQFPEGNYFGASPFGNGMNGSIVVPFGGDRSMMPDDMTKQMNQMFKQLNQQMREMQRNHGAPQGSPLPFSEHEFDFKRFHVPVPVTPKQSDDLPPYSDPNSI